MIFNFFNNVALILSQKKLFFKIFESTHSEVVSTKVTAFVLGKLILRRLFRIFLYIFLVKRFNNPPPPAPYCGHTQPTLKDHDLTNYLTPI